MSYGSNVQPSKFGRGANEPTDWQCICDHVNRKWWKVCQMCGIDRALATKAKDESK